MLVIIAEAHVRSIITVITQADAGVWEVCIIIFESGVIGPRWGIPELQVLRVDDDCFAAPCPTNIS